MMFKKIIRKKHNAFSLIEAMIILLLISAAVMVLIPLISIKTDYPRWKFVEDTAGNYITYGQNFFQRVGIGAVNPYQNAVAGTNATPETHSKFLVDTMNFQNKDAEGIYLGANYDENETPQYFRPTATEEDSSVILGMNACNNYPKNAVILRSQGAATACNSNDIEIGINATTNVPHLFVDDLAITKIGQTRGDSVNEEIYVSDDLIKLSLPDGTPIINWKFNTTDNTSLLVLGNASTTLNVSGSITLHDSTITPPDEYNCTCYQVICANNVDASTYQYETGVSSNETHYSDPVTTKTDKNTHYSYNNDIPTGKCTPPFTKTYCQCQCSNGNSTCMSCKHGSGMFANGSSENTQTSGKTYCNATYSKNYWADNVTTPSDKRLKNIHGEFKKGLSELQKLQTYLFTFKDDVKKRLHAGIIAQKLIGVFNEALTQNEAGFYAYDKSSILYSMINGTKEINQKQIELAKEQKKANKKADKLIRMYE